MPAQGNESLKMTASTADTTIGQILFSGAAIAFSASQTAYNATSTAIKGVS
jgi:hypothetical protein